MGESKRKQQAQSPAEALTRKLIDQGKLIEAGFVSLVAIAYPDTPGPTQMTEMRSCFFAGAQHVFGSLMTMLDPNEEPTQRDFDRMSKISDELDVFIAEFELKHGLVKRNS